MPATPSLLAHSFTPEAAVLVEVVVARFMRRVRLSPVPPLDPR